MNARILGVAAALGLLHGWASGALDERSLRRLVEEGQPAEAARQLVDALDLVNKQAEKPEDAERELLRMVLNLGLEKPVAELQRPPAGASYKLRLEFASLLSLLGLSDEALPALRALMDERPNDSNARGAYLVTLPYDQQLEWLTHQLGKTDEGLVRLWFKSRYAKTGNFAFYLKQTTMLATFLEKLDPVPAKTDLTWIHEHLADLVRTRGFFDRSITPLVGYFGRVPTSDDRDIAARDDLARRIFHASLRQPQLRRQVFMWMHACRERLGIAPDELDQHALDIVADELSGSFPAPVSTDPTVAPRSGLQAMDYLIGQQVDGRTLDPFSNDMLAKVTARDPARGATLTRLASIAAAGGRTAFDGWCQGDAVAQPDAAADELVVIARMAVFRGREDLLEAAALQALALALDNPGNAKPPSLYQVMALRVRGHADAQGKAGAVARLAVEILGKPSTWQVGGVTDGSEAAIQAPRQQIFNAFCESLANDATGAVALARWVARNQPGAFAKVNLQAVFDLKDLSNEQALRLWVESGLLTLGPELMLGMPPDNRTLLESARACLEQYRTMLQPELAELEGPPRFAARLLAASCSRHTDRAYAEVNFHAAEISCWPKPARENLGRFLTKWFSNSSSTADGLAGELLARPDYEAQIEAEAMADKYLRVGFPGGFGNRPPTEEFAAMLRQLIANRAELAAKLWLAALDVHAKPAGSQQSFRPQEWLSSMLGQHDVPIDGLLAFIRQLEKKRPGASHGMIYHIGDAAARSLQNYQKTFSPDSAPPPIPNSAQQWARALQTLARQTPPDALPVLAGVYGLVDTCGLQRFSFADKVEAQLLEWLEAEIAPQWPALAQAARLSLRTRHTSDLTEKDWPALRAAFVGFMGDAAIPAGLRYGTLRNLLQIPALAGVFDEPGCSDASAGLLSAMADADLMDAAAAAETFSLLENVPPAAAARVLESIEAMLGRLRPAHPGSGNYNPRPLLLLAIRSRQSATVERLLRVEPKRWHGDLDLTIRLWRADYGGLAVSLLASNNEIHQDTRRKVESRDNRDRSLPFTCQTEASLPGWLAGIEDKGQRFRIECLLSSAADAQGELAPPTPRRQRLADLVQRFAAEAPKERTARNEALLALAEEDGAAAPLANEYLQAAGNQTLAELADSSRNTPDVPVTRAMILWAMAFAIQHHHDASLMIRQLNATCAEVGHLHLYEKKQRAYGQLGDWLQNHVSMLLRCMLALPRDQQATLAAQSLEIARVLLDFNHENSTSLGATLALAAQAVAGDGAAVERWAETLRPDQTRLVLQYMLGYGLQKLACGSSSSSTTPLWGDKHRDDRRALLACILTDEATYTREFHNRKDVRSGNLDYFLLPFRSFDSDDQIAVIDEIAPTHPRQAELLTRKAALIKKKGAPK
jgi:hypothetical protein